MKLLFVGSVYHQHIYYFSKALRELGQEIFAFDLSGATLDKEEATPYTMVWSKASYPKNKVIDYICKLFGTIFRFLFIHEKIDVVQFHYMDQFYTLPLILLSKFKGFKVSCFVYGSDFLQADYNKKKLLKHIFNKADCVVCDSIALHKELQSFSPNNYGKFHVLNFGSVVIDDLYKRMSGKNVITRLHEGKIVVMCGYNGSPAQNHMKILESVIDFKDNIHLIIPMTYGGEDSYVARIKHYLDSKGFEYELPTDFIPNDVWESILLKTDIFIHMQDSDSFSSALAEHLFLGHVVINADWLRYEEFSDNNIYYISSSIDDLAKSFYTVMSDFEGALERHRSNTEKMYKLKSLTYCCESNWIPYFQKICKK